MGFWKWHKHKRQQHLKLDYTYTTAGDYKISVEAKDDEGASCKKQMR